MSQQINLFNPVFLNQRKYFSTLAILQALALVVLGSALFYGYLVYHGKSLAAQFDEISKRYVDEQAKLNRYTAEFSPEVSGQLLENELKSLNAKLAAQNELIATLKGGPVGNTTGYSEYMRAFARQTVHGLWLNSFGISEGAAQMTIRGAVLSPELLPAFIRGLNQEAAMREKPFASLQMQRSSEGRSVVFTLQSVETAGTAK